MKIFRVGEVFQYELKYNHGLLVEKAEPTFGQKTTTKTVQCSGKMKTERSTQPWSLQLRSHN